MPGKRSFQIWFSAPSRFCRWVFSRRHWTWYPYPSARTCYLVFLRGILDIELACLGLLLFTKQSRKGIHFIPFVMLFCMGQRTVEVGWFPFCMINIIKYPLLLIMVISICHIMVERQSICQRESSLAQRAFPKTSFPGLIHNTSFLVKSTTTQNRPCPHQLQNSLLLD